MGTLLLRVLCVLHLTWQMAQAGSCDEYDNRICNFFVKASTHPCCHEKKKRRSSSPNVSSVNVASVCLGKASTWFMHKSAARWSQVVPRCTASGDLATGAVPLRRRAEPVAAKQIWNAATLCHKFLHSTEVTWKKMRGDLFPPICELETLKRWEGLMGRGTEESEDVSHYSCAYHTCMTPVAISNVYTYLCVPHARPQDVTLIYKIWCFWREPEVVTQCSSSKGRALILHRTTLLNTDPKTWINALIGHCRNIFFVNESNMQRTLAAMSGFFYTDHICTGKIRNWVNFEPESVMAVRQTNTNIKKNIWICFQENNLFSFLFLTYPISVWHYINIQYEFIS